MPNGQTINTSKAVKNASFIVDASDRAGNSSKKTVRYPVK